MSATNTAAGASTASTRRTAGPVTNGRGSARLKLLTAMTAQLARSARASQNGKNPLRGPSVPQPIPSRSESQRTSTPPAINRSAVPRSAARMPPPVGRRRGAAWWLLLQQAALGHEILVQLLVLLEPLDVFRPDGERRLQRPLLHVLGPLRRLDDLPEQRLVPLDRFLRHAGRPEDPAQHQVANVDAQRLLDRRDVLPVGAGQAGAVEHGERPHPPGSPVAHALDRVVHRGVHVLADEVHAHLAAALERHVDELHPEGLLLLDREDLVLL